MCVCIYNTQQEENDKWRLRELKDISIDNTYIYLSIYVFIYLSVYMYTYLSIYRYENTCMDRCI